MLSAPYIVLDVLLQSRNSIGPMVLNALYFIRPSMQTLSIVKCGYFVNDQ